MGLGFRAQKPQELSGCMALTTVTSIPGRIFLHMGWLIQCLPYMRYIKL